jgi:hypothetical protein
VSRIYHLDRGYTRMEEQLNVLGARIERVREETSAPTKSTTAASEALPASTEA